MAADPLDALRQPVVPIAPRAEFAHQLRRTLEAALGLPSPGGSMTDIAVMATPAYVAPGYRTLVPYICVHDSRGAIEWYAGVLGAVPRGEVIVMDDGRIGHAELQFGEAVLMMADEFPEIGVVSPRSQPGSSLSLTLYVADVDATYALALERGATAERPPEDQFYGARSGGFVDPFGHRWSVQTTLAAGAPVPDVPHGIAEVAVVPAGEPAADPVVEVGYFTLATPDVDRAAAFYGALFGWVAEPVRPVSDGDHRYRHVSNTTLPFGFVDDPAASGPDHYYRVPDLQAMVARVRALGGEVVSVDDYESGGNAVCRDDQGTTFQLWQAAPGY